MTLLDEPQVRLHVRWMIRRDLEECLAMEAASTSPWDEETFLRHLRQRDCIGMVAEHGERVVGHMVYTLRKWRLELIKLAGHHGAREALLLKLTSKLSPHRRTAVEFAVDEYDAANILAARNAGFIAEGLTRGPDSDAIDFAYRLKENAWTE